MAQILFYIYYAVVATVVLGDIFSPFSERKSKYLYILFSAPIISFASFRPMGIMRDDTYYVNMLSWTNGAYFSKIFSMRDPLFYTISFLLSNLSKNADLLLYFIGFVLFLKLVVLHKLAGHRRLIVLFMYLSIYWQLHDLTQLRVSLSAFFFLLVFYFIKTNRSVFFGLSIVGSMLSHAQAILNIIFFPKAPIFSRLLLVLFATFFVILMVCRVNFNFTDIYTVINYLLNDPQTSDFNYQLREAFRSYYSISRDAVANGTTLVQISPPIIFVLSVVVHLNSIISLKWETYHLPVIRSATLSIALAIFLSWLFSSFSDVQVRFYEYYFLAGLVLASEISKRRALIGVYLLSLAYFTKFNIKWEIWEMSKMNAILNGI